MWKFVTRQLPVRDPEAAQRWYRDVLGLEAGFVRPEFASVRDDAVELFFARAQAPRSPVTCAVRVDDAEVLGVLEIVFRIHGVVVVGAVALARRAGGVRLPGRPDDGRNPGVRPALTRATANQIGYYRSTGNLETAATRVSNNVALLSEAVVLNYLALHNGGVGRFASVLPTHGPGATAADLDALTAFTPVL